MFKPLGLNTFDKCTHATSLILGVLYEFALEFSRKILASEIHNLKNHAD